MSDTPRKKVTLNYLRQKKAAGERITSIGVYDAPMAAIADRVDGAVNRLTGTYRFRSSGGRQRRADVAVRAQGSDHGAV